MSLITTDLVSINSTATTRDEIFADLAGRLGAAGRLSDVATYIEALEAREAQMPTGLGGGIGIPHAKSAAVIAPSLAFASVPAGIDFGAEDGKSTLIFMIAAPEGGSDTHLAILGQLARKLINEQFKTSLANAATAEEVVSIISESVGL